MRKKILLIEDRPGRQSQFLSDQEILSLHNLEFLEIPLKDKCKEWLDHINTHEFQNIEEYDLVIVHKSPLTVDSINNLSYVCKKTNAGLILFSGGLTQVSYQTIEFPFLSINSSVLYSDKLIKFLSSFSNDKTISLLELVYGEKWKLEALLRYRLMKTSYEAESNNELKFALEDQLSILEQPIKKEVQNLDNEINKIFLSL